MNPAMYHRFVALTMVLAGCGGKAAAPSTPSAPVAPAPPIAVSHPHLQPGETITWVVTFAGVEAAKARMATGSGDAEIAVRAEAQSSGVLTMLKESQEVATTWIDAQSGLPRQMEFYSIDGDRTLKVVITREKGQAQQVITRSRRGDAPAEPKTRVHALPSGPVFDSLSGLAVIRAWDAKPGDRATLWSFSGQRLWRTTLTAEKEEDLDSDLGKLKTRKIVASSSRLNIKAEDDDKEKKPPREWTLWVSTDERRIPVRIQAKLDFGDVVVKATSYETAAEQKP